MNKEDRLLFIYTKWGRFIVLGSEEARHVGIVLGHKWKHTATIDPELWIEALLNEGRVEEMIADLKGEQP
jgi:hypothetical protein